MGNRYLNKFFSLRCAPDVLATVGTVANMEKELTEAIGILRHVQRIVLRDKSKPFLLLDFCAGNALASVLAVHLFSNVTAIAVDKLPRKRNWHFAQRFRYVTQDIYQPIGKLLDDREAIAVGVHACGNLAHQIIRYYAAYTDIKHLVLLPCCSGKCAPMPALLHDKLDKYEQWAYSLYLAAQVYGKECNIVRDRHIQSPKNIIVTANK